MRGMCFEVSSKDHCECLGVRHRTFVCFCWPHCLQWSRSFTDLSTLFFLKITGRTGHGWLASDNHPWSLIPSNFPARPITQHLLLAMLSVYFYVLWGHDEQNNTRLNQTHTHTHTTVQLLDSRNIRYESLKQCHTQCLSSATLLHSEASVVLGPIPTAPK